MINKFYKEKMNKVYLNKQSYRSPGEKLCAPWDQELTILPTFFCGR